MHPDQLSDGDYERLARLLAGEGSDAERLATEQWAAGDSSRAAALEAMRIAWKAPLPEPVWDVDGAWSKLSSRVAGAGSAARTAPGAAPRNDFKGAPVVSIAARRRWWLETGVILRVAAAAVILIAGATLLPRLRSSSDNRTQVAIGEPASFATATGQRRSVKLPDGSVVSLGVSSTLRAREGFGKGAREIELTGEALFTVVHDQARPFRVFVGKTVIEDLGTEFAVRGYGESESVRVAVASGSVAVRHGASADTAIVLEPRDMATIAGAGSIDVQRGIDVSPFTAFSSGRLIFTDTPLADVARDLERWYGVQVRVTDAAIADKHLTVTFERETLDEVLRIIGMSLDVRYTRTGAQVQFLGSGYSSSAPRDRELQLAEGGA
ncbi:MAG: FecR domain-containing protein [Gemmatimonadaceae bacterium]|nr:FecR domain-containing protein [Gemmatimonadaceae bacterium]